MFLFIRLPTCYLVFVIIMLCFIDKASRWVFDVADRGEPNPYAEACIAWYSEQQSISQGISLVSGLVCPCSSWQARYDERFFYDYNSDCALSLYPSQGYYLVSLMFQI